MAWSNTGPGAAKYRTAEHRRERLRWVKILKRDGTVQCAQPVCLMSDRSIFDGQPWHLGHDDAGSSYIGPTHPECNVRDGAIRGNRRSRGLQDSQPRRWVL